VLHYTGRVQIAAFGYLLLLPSWLKKNYFSGVNNITFRLVYLLLLPLFKHKIRII
jgi:hypothetical protein